MMTQTGQVNSFKELGEHFLEFVQKSNDTTDSWEVIDDRLDSFYGATIKFPVSGNRDSDDLASIMNKSSIKVMNIIYEALLPSSTYYVTNLVPNSGYIAKYSPSSSADSIYLMSGVSNMPSNYFDVCYNAFNLPTVQSSTSISVRDTAYNYFIADSDNPNKFNFSTILDSFYSKHNFKDALIANDRLAEFTDSVSNADLCILQFPIYSYEYLFDALDIYAKFINKVVASIYEALDFVGVNIPVVAWGIIFPLLCDSFDNAGTIKYQNYIDTMCAEVGTVFSSYVNRCACKIFNGFKYYSPTFKVRNVDNQLPRNMSYPKLPYAIKLSFIHAWNENSINSDFLIELDSIFPVNMSVDTVIPCKASTLQEIKPILIYYLYVGRYVSNWYYIDGTNVENLSDYLIDIKYLDSLYAYISLQYNKITPTTYNDWLTNTKDHYMSETFNSNRRRPVWYSNSLVYERTTISNQRQNDIANIFKNTGEVLFISPHIKYDKNLWMAEQGGIACDHETRNQSIEDNCLRAHLLRYPVSGGTPQLTFQKLPPFPSLGCPMFTIDDKQLSQSVDIGEAPIKYYFVRDNNSASIVIYSRLTGANAGSYAVQHMSFGALNCFSISEQFLYPLYVAGGNGALDKEHWVFYYPNGGTPQHDVGNIYNLDMGSISMSNSNIALSAKFNGANITNFRVLCPDGHWDNIFNVVQTCQLVVDPDECYPNAWTTRYYLYNKPGVGGSELGDNRYGGTVLEYGYNNIKKIDTHLINHDYLGNPSTRMYIEDLTASSPLTPIVPTFSSHKNVSPEIWSRHRYGSIGMIPHCYTSWSRYLKFGELEINGKKFLAIPCAYEDRLWWPETRTSVNLANLDNQMNMMRNINNKLSNYMIYDYVLLELEE